MIRVNLPGNKGLTWARHEKVIKRAESNGFLRENIKRFFEDWENLGIIEIVPEEEVKAVKLQKVFDANGLLSPATSPPKLLLQETWKLELPWDSELPKNIVNKFMKWSNEMYLLKEVTVPRYIAKNETSELHSVFVRTVVENAERVLIRLVQDKMFPNLKSIPIVNVFKDNERIIRVKTKITERKDDPNFIAPILMPSKCLLTTI
ncbi:uncharacterized protein TNCV_15691 [Trichonephila clavipes]|nr:uncharacterized protein TNCV_15691 [Trichonephila clavipes]